MHMQYFTTVGSSGGISLVFGVALGNLVKRALMRHLASYIGVCLSVQTLKTQGNGNVCNFLSLRSG